MDTGWKSFTAFKAAQVECDVSIPIIVDTGWKVIKIRLNDECKNGFNPHHSGYGLEVGNILEAKVTRTVSIPIIVDTGWKRKESKVGFEMIVTVSIPIIVDTGWKTTKSGSLACTCVAVSIPIIVDTGWKKMSKETPKVAVKVSIPIIVDTGWKEGYQYRVE